MIGSLVIFFAVMWIMTGDLRINNRKRYLFEYAQTETVTLIKYDGWTVRLFGILTIVSAFAFLTSVVIAEYVDPVAGLFLAMFGCLFLILLAYWLSGKCYLYRLEKYGYEIPWRSRDYGFILEKVPRTEVILEQKPYNRRSKVFFIIYGYIWLCLLAINVWFCCNWSFFDGIGFFFGVLLIIDLYWLFMAFKHRKQMCNEEYKEDVEIDKYRKDRISLEKAIFVLLVMGLIFWGIKATEFNYVEYIYRARVEADRHKVEEMHSTMEQAYRELMGMDATSQQGDADSSASEETIGDWEISRQQLTKGVDITNWGIPQDAYQEKLAEYLGISDFGELKDDFRSVKGEAILVAQLEEGRLILHLVNVIKEVNGPIIEESEKVLIKE